MSISRNHKDASLNAAERLHRSARPPLSPFPHKSNFLSVKPCVYLLALIFFCLFAVMPAIAGVDKVVYWAPWVTKTTINSATINWRGTSDGSGSIEYARLSYYNKHNSFDKTIESGTTGTYQHVELTDLEPNTSYLYRVKPSDNINAFGNRTFRTMPVKGPFTFIVISDAHAQDKRFKYVADAIAANETDALFILDGGDYANYDDETLWTPFFKDGDGMLAKFPIFTTIGNHEYHNPGGDTPTDADQYHWSFDIPTNGALNYSFDCAGIRFIILNSPDPNNANDEDPTLVLSQSQAPWLEELLKGDMAGVFTIHHHPIWHYGRATSDSALQSWETLYHQYNISANFAGHVHNYERHSVKGIPYFVVGNAGGKFADMNAGDPYPSWYQVGTTRQLGYLKVTVNPAKNRATAQEILVGSVETDSSTDVTLYDPPIIFDIFTFPLKPTGGGSGGGCFIATAAFGSPLAGQVEILRQFRDKYLMNSDLGRQFVSWYYRNGPDAANYIKDKPLLKAAVRVALYPVIGFSLLLISGFLPFVIVGLLMSALLFLRLRPKKLSVT